MSNQRDQTAVVLDVTPDPALQLGSISVHKSEAEGSAAKPTAPSRLTPHQHFFGGLASSLLRAITVKPSWETKIKDDTIVAKWRAEFTSQAEPGDGVFAGLDVEACGRIFDATIVSLRRSVANQPDPRELYSQESMDCRKRPLPTEIDIDKTSCCIKCACDCGMCGDGSFYYNRSSDDDEEEEDETNHSKVGEWNGIPIEKDEPGGNEKQRAKCSCYPNYKEKLRLGRAEYLRDKIVNDARLVPASLRDDVVALFERLEAAPQPDWHPGSNGMMQDLIHPSLGCYVRGVHGAPNAAAATFQWLPADVRLNGKGQAAEVVGRGFHGCPDAEAQAVLVRLLDRALPHLEEVIRRSAPEGSPHAVPLRDRTVQVIAKAASARLTADKPVFPEGSWHLEGVASEQIIATAIYYPPGPNVGPSSLSFRVGVADGFRVPQDGKDYVKVHYGFNVGEKHCNRFVIAPCELGQVPTVPGTMLVFPNNLQHKVSSYALAPGAEEGRRRVVLFWLVAPGGDRVPSTADVPDPTMSGTIGRAEQEAYRELLMLERKYVVAAQSYVYERMVNLCEH